VSEGGLDPRSWWYIPESGIYHQSKVTRQGPAGPASHRQTEAAAPACPTGPGMWPAETTRVVSRDRAACRAGPR